jgi:DNA polymerase-3 subunit gamma/tau
MIEQSGGGSALLPSGGGGGAAAPRGASSASVSAAPSYAAIAPRSAPTMLRGGAETMARPQADAPAAAPQPAPAALTITTFPQLVALASEKRDVMTRMALEADVRLVRIEDGRLELALERTASRSLIGDLGRKLEQWTGRRWTVIISNEPGQPTLRSQNEAQKNERERAAEADPRVQEVLARFPGAKVIEVRRLAAEPAETDAGIEDPADTIDDDDS